MNKSNDAIELDVRYREILTLIEERGFLADEDASVTETLREAALALEAKSSAPASGLPEGTSISVSVSDLDSWRKEWLGENDPQDGTDCITPFDGYLYTTSPVTTPDEVSSLLAYVEAREKRVGRTGIGSMESRICLLSDEDSRLRKLDNEYGMVETAIIMADPSFDGDSDHPDCGSRLIDSVKRLAASGGSVRHDDTLPYASEARRHAVELEQCSIFAADVGPSIAKSMTDAAAFLRSLSPDEAADGPSK